MKTAIWRDFEAVTLWNVRSCCKLTHSVWPKSMFHREYYFRHFISFQSYSQPRLPWIVRLSRDSVVVSGVKGRKCKKFSSHIMMVCAISGPISRSSCKSFVKANCLEACRVTLARKWQCTPIFLLSNKLKKIFDGCRVLKMSFSPLVNVNNVVLMLMPENRGCRF